MPRPRPYERHRSVKSYRGRYKRSSTLCGTGPCLYAILALVTPAAAGAPAPDLPDWLAARLRATTAGPAGDRPSRGARYEYRGGAGYFFSPRRCDIPSEPPDAPRGPPCRPPGGLPAGHP